MNQFAPHFPLAELVSSNKAAQLKIDNTPPADVLQELVHTSELLERIRATLGVPVTVTSAYRCPALNRAVGGVTSSDHVTGQAADMVAPAFGTPYEIARLLAPLVSTLGIGQLILEGVKGKQWVHVSTRVPQYSRNRIITITDAGAQAGIVVLA
jgi:hypothetical protein